MGAEPTAGKLNDPIERARLFEQVGGARDNLQPLLAGGSVEGPPIDLDHGMVVAADDQQGRGADVRKRAARQIGPSSAGKDSGDVSGKPGSGNQGSGWPVLAPNRPMGSRDGAVSERAKRTA